MRRIHGCKFHFRHMKISTLQKGSGIFKQKSSYMVGKDVRKFPVDLIFIITI